MIVDEKIPPLKKLIEIALKNDISITDVKGDPLNKNQLYDKLKFRYPELLQPKQRKKIKTEYVKRILNVEDRQKEFEKLKAKTAKLTQKEEERVAFLLRVFIGLTSSIGSGSGVCSMPTYFIVASSKR